MTADHDKPAGHSMRSVGEGGVAFEDLTARARIREAALKHFAEQGYALSTIRDIAQTAGVSPGLLRHHYGSKDDLRKACDEYVVETLHRVNAQLFDDPTISASTQQVSKQFGSYIARSLVDGSPTIGTIFDETVTITEQWLARADGARCDTPTIDRRIRAALVTAMKVGIPLLHEHVSRALGVDMFSPDGERLVALGLLDIYSHKLIDGTFTSAAETGFNARGANPG